MDEQPKYPWKNPNHHGPSNQTEAPASSTPSTTTPADYSALGKKGAVIQRAARQRRMTATERKAYRAGYQAQHMLVTRFLRAIERVRQSLVSVG